MDRIEILYKNYDILAEAKDKISEHEKEYLEILEAVKGEPSEKRLASQFIARFFKDFPHLAEKAIDAQLDLCEDADVAIRKQAIKDLPVLCKDNKEYVNKIADVLAQLLPTEDSSELVVIYNSLVTLIKLDPKGSLGGLFSQILNGEDVVREKAIKFLSTKLPVLSSEILNKEVEEFLLQECCKVMQDVTGEEFVTLMSLLSGLKLAKTVPGQQSLVELVADQAELEKKFESEDTDCVVKLIQCIKQAMPFFSPFVSSHKFVQYICVQVLPSLNKLTSEQEGQDICLELLKVLAEIASHATKLEDDSVCIENTFKKLLEYMPLPPSDDNMENSTEEPSLQLSHVECLVYTFHQLAKRSPEFLTAESSAERLRDFKLRLQYLARGIQGYIRKLKEALKEKKKEELKSEENKLKIVALKTTSNINILIRDLFHVPPSFKSTIVLSWKPAAVVKQTDGPGKAEKRPITFSDSSDRQQQLKKTGKIEREIYTPPSGKYSTKVKNFQVPMQRGRGFGRFRGRGRRGRLNS